MQIKDAYVRQIEAQAEIGLEKEGLTYQARGCQSSVDIKQGDDIVGAFFHGVNHGDG